ncbi:hypothetical protein PHLGIDRAFT_500048 [Phlebiopsis gigantea 11061_1 CR5-6]|uniref:Peptidase metallopeptidase domain-containing protein n=1 Tax=Phlebiopsis gigantea (strain 11061_1 CR5-6) TaxID=745531 RepID=A0A0C3NE10_PHLG1|nr:hypothetical protein PHLGIDRAFT_500048 [Phlebiopsis gigantea 11061_1 CR5-6]
MAEPEPPIAPYIYSGDDDFCLAELVPSERPHELASAAIRENPRNASSTYSSDAGSRGDRTQALAIYTTLMWEPGRTLKVKFVDSSATAFQREKVQQYAQEWMQHANIRFQFNVAPNEPAEIRITFLGTGNNSHIGVDALSITDQTQATMKLTSVAAGQTEEIIRRTVLHEFGHVLGLVHEHQSPTAGIKWDMPEVYRFHKEDLKLSWDHTKVYNHLMRVFLADVVRATAFDPESIMLYTIRSTWTTDHYSATRSTHLSPTDIAAIGREYPFPSPAPLHLPGINWLDLNILRIKTHVQDVTTTGAKLELESWGGTHNYSSGCAWLSVPADDADLQFGRFSTMDDHPWEDARSRTTADVTFARPYAAIPNVVVWLDAADLDKTRARHFSALATNVGPAGFTLEVTAYDDARVWLAGVRWLAYAASRLDIRSGRFQNQAGPDGSPPAMQHTGRVSFGATPFAKRPQVFMALNALNIEKGPGGGGWGTRVRVRISKSGVTEQGME